MRYLLQRRYAGCSTLPTRNAVCILPGVTHAGILKQKDVECKQRSLLFKN